MKKSKLISGKNFASAKAIPSMVALAVLVSVIITVGLALVSGGYLLRAMWRKSRKEETPLDWYRMPEPSVEPIGSIDLETTFRTEQGRIRVFPAQSQASA